MITPYTEKLTLAIFISENWSNIVFGLFGVAGTIFGYSSWKSSKKSTATYKYLFKLAERHIDKSLTDEGLLETKQKLNEEAERIKELQRKIRNEIPIEARRAVLRDKLETNIEQIHEVYLSLNKAREQLKKLGEEVTIPPEIKNEIDSEIQPEYILKRKKSDLRNYLTFITATAAISSAILPYPFSRFASWFMLGLFGIPIIILLLRLSWKDARIYMIEIIIPFMFRKLYIIGGSLVMFGFLFPGTFETFVHRSDYDNDLVLFISALSLVSGLICIFFKLIMRIIKNCSVKRG
jgi:hypothetical protein